MCKAILTNTVVYQKPTGTHPYLHWTSAHPPYLKRSTLYSQALMLRGICLSTDTLKKWIIENSDFFVARDYEGGKVLDEMQYLQTKERQPMDRIPFVITYNTHSTLIAEVAKRNWNFLQSKERLALIFNKPPLITQRRAKSLRDRLVSTKCRNGATDETLIPRGRSVCQRPRCSWGNKINETQTFKSTSNNKIFHHISICGLPIALGNLHQQM